MDIGESSYRRFLAGDDTGLYDIICAYQDGLVLYLNSLVQNFHTAQDLAEDTFVELAVKHPKYSGKSTFKTWLYAIAKNIAFKQIRKTETIEAIPLESQEWFSDGKDIEMQYIQDVQKQELHHALHRLHQEYRQVLYLVYFEGFDNAETALIMKKTKRQVEMLLYHAKKALKNELEKEGFQYESL